MKIGLGQGLETKINENSVGAGAREPRLVKIRPGDYVYPKISFMYPKIPFM